MPDYRRNYETGGTYFLTLVAANRRELFTSEFAFNCLKEGFRRILPRWPTKIIAFSILPDHIHAMIHLPEETANFSMRVSLFKQYFSKSYKARMSEEKHTDLWQARFWEHTIRDQEDWHNHLDYIHYNAAKHGLVADPSEWKWSSLSYYMRDGLYEFSFGRYSEAPRTKFGE